MEYALFTHRIGLIIAILCPLQLNAAVYQWTDEHGRVQFSDRAVNEAATEVKIRVAPSTPQAADAPRDRRARQQRMLDAYEEERAAKKELAAQAKQERKERQRKCLDARARYDEYSTAGSIYNYLENGERDYLDKNRRAQFIEGLKVDVEKYCK